MNIAASIAVTLTARFVTVFVCNESSSLNISQVHMQQPLFSPVPDFPYCKYPTNGICFLPVSPAKCLIKDWSVDTACLVRTLTGWSFSGSAYGVIVSGIQGSENRMMRLFLWVIIVFLGLKPSLHLSMLRLAPLPSCQNLGVSQFNFCQHQELLLVNPLSTLPSRNTVSGE